MVFDKLSGIIAQQFGVSKDEITEETSFVEDLGADSLDRKSTRLNSSH